MLARKMKPLFADNIVQFPMEQLVEIRNEENSQIETKHRGTPIPTPADPIKSLSDIKAMQEYFLSRGEFRNYAILTLGISWALRAGDLLSLKICDVYEINGEVKSNFTINEDKTNKRNKIHISAACKTVLEKYIETLKLARPWDPLFQSRNHDENGELRPITLMQLNRILKRAKEACHIREHISSHSMRKTFVYQMIKAHEGDQNTLMLLQKMLNHSDIRITFRYCGIEDECIAGMREEIGAMII